MNRHIRTVEDVLVLLDGFFPRGTDWWDEFYADRDRPVPFFVAKPDESLVSYLGRGLLKPGRALDLGCGPGRNALHLAANGFTVDAVDLSATAIAWARERAPRAHRVRGRGRQLRVGDRGRGAVPQREPRGRPRLHG